MNLEGTCIKWNKTHAGRQEPDYMCAKKTKLKEAENTMAITTAGDGETKKMLLKEHKVSS